MFHKLIFSFLIFTLIGCTSKKRTVSVKNPRPQVTVVGSGVEKNIPKKDERPNIKNAKADDVISTALNYAGVRYKYGGTTKKGMDCSGLIYVALKENDILFPRNSYHMSQEGERVKLGKVQKGDLLFFDTQKRRRRINHVGLVVDVDGDEIQFIHSTSSRGVIVSSLREGYWNHAFVKAARIL